MPDLYLYVPIKSPRVAYTFKLIFKYILSDAWQVHIGSNWKDFCAFDGPKISYGKKGCSDAFFIPNSGFLEETCYRTCTPELRGYGEQCVLFPIESDEGLDFDLPAAVFYVVSRYEEYHCNSIDAHHRFRSKDSLAYLHGFLDWPIAQVWVEKLASRLCSQFSTLARPKKTFEFLSTIDVDNGFKFRGKPLWRNLGGLVLDGLKFKGRQVRYRFALLFMGEADPYDNYRWLKRQVKRSKLPVRIFILHTPKGKYDHAVEPGHSDYKELLTKLRKIGKLALHPSYSCLDDPGRLILEKQGLQSKLKRRRMLHVRRHFLRIRFPDSFRQAHEIGFRHEHSVGYSDVLGFRAGVSVSYPFFDVERDAPSTLMIHPFSVMETVFRYYQKVSAEDAFRQIELLMRRVAQFGGRFISVWHDRSFSREAEARPWAELYRSHLELALELKSENKG